MKPLMWSATRSICATGSALPLTQPTPNGPSWRRFRRALLVGRPPGPMRKIVNAIFYILRGGIPSRMLPPCFPPRQTVYGWFAFWRDAGVWQSINHHIVMLDRERVGRETSPSAAVIDSHSVKTTEAGRPRMNGIDLGVLNLAH
jgi:transposase